MRLCMYIERAFALLCFALLNITWLSLAWCDAVRARDTKKKEQQLCTRMRAGAAFSICDSILIGPSKQLSHTTRIRKCSSNFLCLFFATFHIRISLICLTFPLEVGSFFPLFLCILPSICSGIWSDLFYGKFEF